MISLVHVFSITYFFTIRVSSYGSIIEALVNAAQAKLDEIQVNYEYISDNCSKMKILYEAGAISESEYLGVKNKMDTVSKQMLTAKEQLKSNQAQLQLLKNGVAIQSIQATEADVRQAEAMLKQAELNLSKQILFKQLC